MRTRKFQAVQTRKVASLPFYPSGSLAMSTPDPSSKSDSVQAKLRDKPESTSSNIMNTALWQSRELNFIHVPDKLPENLQMPKYAIGDRCRWIPRNTTDWGTVVGQVLAPIEPVQPATSRWVWLYLVLLDLDSPSRQWVVTDWAEEGELERLHPPA